MKAPLYNTLPMTEARLACLGELIRLGERGGCSLRGVMDGAQLATLVMMGLAERMATDERLGGQRYRVTLAGVRAHDFWTKPPLASLPKPRNWRAVMSSRDTTADDTDFFPTPPWGARAGAELIRQLEPRATVWWECAAGGHHMAHGLRDYAPRLHTSDAFEYYMGDPLFDFLSAAPAPFRADWVVTNPPFAHIERFIELAYARADRGVALLMRLAVLEGQARHAILYGSCPLYAVAPFSERLPMVRGRWDPSKPSAAAYAWFIWRKGSRPGRYPLVMPIAPGARERLTRPSDDAYSVGEAA